MTTTIAITLDGKQIEVPKGTTVYQAAKQHGIEIPIFCYHDRMPPFGACRMCLVQVEKMPKLQASCTLEATEGMIVNTQAQMAVDGRKEILELLLINHPLDCPICDRGGECPLQDNALKYGPGLSRFFEEKRHFKKALPLGPVLMLDRERCIVCARCTRFGDELAGDHALTFIERGFRTEVGTKDGAPVESKFIGNTIMICPVGALTSQVYRFRARPWDNDTTPSTCTLCPVGCSLKLDARDGEIMRTRSNENHAVNDIWLCDKGWFGYEFGTDEERLTTPLIRKNGTLTPATWEEAITLIASKVKEAKPAGKLAAFGGNPLTTEENYLFQQLVRKGFGVEHLDHRIGMPLLSLDEEGIAPGMTMEIGDLEKASQIVLLGLDLTEEFPVIWLRIRQALNKGASVIFIGNYAPEIAPYLTNVITHAPGKELETLKTHLPDNGVFLVGRQYLASPNRTAILSYLMQFQNTSLNLLEGNGNSMGARLAGMHPELKPLGEKSSAKGLDGLSVVNQAAKEGWDLLYVAGSNPARKFPKTLWEEARKNLGFLVVQDLFLTETAATADVVLPTLAYTEKKGTFINIEGRTQSLHVGKQSPENLHSDGEIFLRLAQKLGLHLIFEKEFSDVLKQKVIAPIRSEEIKVTSNAQSGQLLATFSSILFDQGVRMEHSKHLFKNVKAPVVRIHPSDGEKAGIASGTLGQLKSKDGSIKATLQWDAQVAPGTLVIPTGFKEIAACELNPKLINGIPIELEGVK
jgi:NADH-quinone oxidoreductase subunit G